MIVKYEIWGEDNKGQSALLGYVNGNVPDVGDTIVVRGDEREVEKVWRHHVGAQSTRRVKVGRPLAAASE